MDILDGQNVYSIDEKRERNRKNSIDTNRGYLPGISFIKQKLIINIVFKFTKTGCSNEYDTKKCMGTSKNDQFRG